MAAPARTIGIAARGCCPICLELARKSEDGWLECLDCVWFFRVEASLDGTTYTLHLRQAATIVEQAKAAAVVGLRGFRVEGGTPS